MRRVRTRWTSVLLLAFCIIGGAWAGSSRAKEPLFEGKETPGVGMVGVSRSSCAAVADAALCDGVAGYASNLKKTDKDFGSPSPVDPFECELDAGKGKGTAQPIRALCANFVHKVIVKGDWASVKFLLAPVEKRYKKLPVMADGSLCFLMKKDKSSAWRGVQWFLGSDTPSLTKKKAKDLAISGRVLTDLGWRVEEE